MWTWIIGLFLLVGGGAMKRWFFVVSTAEGGGMGEAILVYCGFASLLVATIGAGMAIYKICMIGIA